MYSRLPPLNQLRGFEAAARLGSFKAAGEELNITPTAISHQIATLEETLGVSLFERKTRAISLTKSGTRLAQAVHLAFQQLASAVEDISDAQSVLRISTTTSFASMWLVPNLSSFQTRHPDIQIEIRTDESLTDLEKDRSIDLAIRYGSSEKPAKNAIKLVDESFSAYATEDYLNQHKKLGYARFIETKWKNTNLPAITWEHWLKEFYPSVKDPEIHHFDQEHHVIQAALSGQGIALVSSVLADMAIQQGWLKPFSNDSTLPGLTYYLLVSPYSDGSRKTELFKSWLIQALSEKA